MRRHGADPVARADIDPAALALIARRGPEIFATARRYSANLDDAEDAYQRGLEILLTKAPTTAEEELVPWLKTVVKHEAFAIRRQRERQSPVTDSGAPAERPTGEQSTHEHAERYDKLRRGAEALRLLKPQEVRALVLRAEGYSYKQICEITGWTHTKVNRCLSEGRQAFLARVAGIEMGGECERLAPLLSALADGEVGAEELAAIRPHLRTCLACRARLREYRAAPSRVAALVPPAAIAAAAGGDPGPGALRSLLESLAGATQHKAAAIGERAGSLAEVVSAQKVAAVAASAAVVAGGGAAGVEKLRGDEPAKREQAAAEVKPVNEPVEPPPVTKQEALEQPPVEPAAAPPAPQREPPPPPDPANEFSPGPSPTPPPAASAASAPPPTASAPSSGPAGGPASQAGGGEFGP
jgi:RNA polymerase sigma factor (sigma-70 family)